LFMLSAPHPAPLIVKMPEPPPGVNKINGGRTIPLQPLDPWWVTPF
jgi:hypothetical protein